MRKYNVNVNGTAYEVTVEEIIDGQAAPVAAPVVAAAPAPVATPAPAAAPAPVAAPVTAGEGTAVNAPMPGTILAVNVAVGDTVANGQVLCILEAMKMENEIMAPCAGKITSVAVTKGASVETNALICTIA